MNGEGFIYDRRRARLRGGEPTAAAPRDRSPTATSTDARSRVVARRPPDRLRLGAATRTRDHDDVGDLWLVRGRGRRAAAAHRHGRAPSCCPPSRPTARTIAYLGHEHALTTSGATSGSTPSRADGGDVRAASTAALDRTCAPLGGDGPLWSADGRSIYFAVEDQGARPGLPRRAPGGAPERGDRRRAAWSPGSRRCRRPPLAFAASDPVAPAEVFVGAADGSGERPLTDLNRRWRDEVALARPERFRFERDGLHARRLGDAARRLRAGTPLPGAAERPRRPARAVRLRLLRRVPGPGGRRLRA